MKVCEKEIGVFLTFLLITSDHIIGRLKLPKLFAASKPCSCASEFSTSNVGFELPFV